MLLQLWKVTMAAEMLLMGGINSFRKVTLKGQNRVCFNTPHLKEQVRLTSCCLSIFYIICHDLKSTFPKLHLFIQTRFLERHRLFGEIRPAQQHVYGQICLFHQDHRYNSGPKREDVDTTKDAKTPDSRKHKQMVQHIKL